MAGARSAVSQPSPPSSRSASIRADVIIPRSPTSTSRASPNRLRTTSTMVPNAAGSVSSPYSICGKPFLPSRE